MYSTDIASAITSAGQLSILWAEKEINKWLNEKVFKNSEPKDYVIAIDTDSLVIELGDLVEMGFGTRKPDDTWKVVNFLDNFAEKKMVSAFENAYKNLANYVNAHEQAMEMERENIADCAVWTAKKRYIMNILDEEGIKHDPPKQKIMGLEAIRSTIPEISRNKLKECYRIILQEDESKLISEVSKFYKEWHEQNIEDIAFNSSIRGLSKYSDSRSIYTKGTPIHVRGSLVFNDYITKSNLKNQFPKINEGEKIKYVHLKNPNPLHESVLAFPGFYPRDGELEHFVDYEEQFNKTFIKPLEGILEVINWDYEEKATLDSFFM